MLKNTKVDKFMDDLQDNSPDNLKLIESIRKIFLNANQKLTEDIKYGGLVFNLSDSLIGGVFPYKAHISIEFSNGTDLTDPTGMLEGKGKKRRHLKIIDEQDIDKKNVAEFVAEAVSA